MMSSSNTSRETRKRAASYANSSASRSHKKKGRGERLLDAGKHGEVVAKSFVDDATAVSRELVTQVANKAAEIYVTFADVASNNHEYYGQGGLIMGSKVAETPEQSVQEVGLF